MLLQMKLHSKFYHPMGCPQIFELNRLNIYLLQKNRKMCMHCRCMIRNNVVPKTWSHRHTRPSASASRVPVLTRADNWLPTPPPPPYSRHIYIYKLQDTSTPCRRGCSRWLACCPLPSGLRLLQQLGIHTHHLGLVARVLLGVVHGAVARSVQLEHHVLKAELPDLHDDDTGVGWGGGRASQQTEQEQKQGVIWQQRGTVLRGCRVHVGGSAVRTLS